VLPPKIASRKGKGNIYEALARAIDRDWGNLGEIAKWEVCSRGYVNAKHITASLLKMRMGIDDKCISALHVIILERFLRSLPLVKRQHREMPIHCVTTRSA
jgi:hypothetical protein